MFEPWIYLGGPPDGIGYDIRMQPDNPDIMYVGETWERAGFGMDPNEEITDVLPDPNRSGVIYAGSRSSGVFAFHDPIGSSDFLLNGARIIAIKNLNLV